MAIEFNTTEYCASHGHEPRGRGAWAFFPSRECRMEEAIWTPSMTYTEAKRWVKVHIKNLEPLMAPGVEIEIWVGS